MEIAVEKLIHPAAAAFLVSVHNSVSETLNSATPQSGQIKSSGNTHTMGFSRFSPPGQWIAISALNFFCWSDPHDLQVIDFPFG
jgi:hypothetical protein